MHLGPDRQLPRDIPTSIMELRSSLFDVRTSNFELGVGTSMFDLLGQTEF